MVVGLSVRLHAMWPVVCVCVCVCVCVYLQSYFIPSHISVSLSLFFVSSPHQTLVTCDILTQININIVCWNAALATVKDIGHGAHTHTHRGYIYIHLNSSGNFVKNYLLKISNVHSRTTYIPCTDHAKCTRVCKVVPSFVTVLYTQEHQVSCGPSHPCEKVKLIRFLTGKWTNFISMWHSLKLLASYRVTGAPSPPPPHHVICCDFRSTNSDQNFITAIEVRLTSVSIYVRPDKWPWWQNMIMETTDWPRRCTERHLCGCRSGTSRCRL